MRILITGHRGQLGRALMALLKDEEVMGVGRPDHDITNRRAITQAIADFAPHLVIHCAAMTDVEGCARDPEAAYRVNGLGTQNVVLACQTVGAALLYVSTNEVFDGSKGEPYDEWDTPRPINPYGCSKRAGEWYVQNLLDRFYIVRTAWLYAAGGRNFPHRIVQLADERGALRVVTDEVGSPTYAADLAEAIVALIGTGAYGVYHLVNEGVTSRYDFAREILRLTGREQVPVEAITLADYPRASRVPPYTPLRNTAAAALGIRLRPWQEAVADFLEVTGYG